MPSLPPSDPSPERVEAIFHAALEIPDRAAREALIAAECKDDLVLEMRVRRLLSAHDEGGLLTVDTPLSPEMAAELARLKPEQDGEQIGNYKLREQIGEGGFGTVWVADQERPIQRRVALKIIKLGMDTKEVIARFEQERQALALMDHPNIAKVLDAGVTQFGRPYFVMELVRGIRITDYCDQAKLPTAQRLDLFIQVCHAVQHAHQKGIIHRDLKPSNILVTLHDGAPVPKVIDFGIAKAMQQRLTDLTIYTRFEQMIGTPLYMSPEQTEMNGLNIDTRSDIYSLGVLLYELLVGVTPFDPKELMKAGHDEMRRVIREQEPPKPSTALSTMVAELRTTVAQHRQSDPARMAGQLRGDLDWIVMKALAKDRARRYDTANSFAEDIRRHLTSEPVVACPPSTAYVFQKFVRRHRTAFAAGSAIVLALLAGIAVSSWQAVRATRAEQASAEESIKVETERDHARKAEQEAKDQRQLADTARGNAEHNLYAASMNLAQADWEQANISRLHGIFEETRTYPNRGFEWYYWQRQTHLDLRTLRGHEDRVLSVAFSPDGRRVVTGSEDKTAKVWDAQTGRELLTLKGHTESVSSVAFSPDGRRILTGSDDATAKVWDVETGRELLTLNELLTGDTSSSVKSVVFSPDGRRILTGTFDKIANVWDAETGRELLTLKGHTEMVNSVAFSPDGRRILTGSWDHTTKVWDAQTGRELLSLKGHTESVSSVAFSPDGRRILTGSRDNTTKTWDAETGRELFILKGHTSPVSSAAFSPDGRRILTGSWDKTAKVWDAETGREPLTLKAHTSLVSSVAFSPDGRRILTGSADQTARVWAAETGRELVTLKGHTGIVWSVAFSPDGRRILTGSNDKTAKTWDAETGRELLTLKGHTGLVWSVAFSSDGRRILTGSDDQIAKVWDTETGRELLTLKGHTESVSSVAFFPDGRRILTGSRDKTAKVWDAETGHELLTLKGHKDAVGSVALSPDGRRILTGSDDATTKVWDAETGRELLTLKGHDRAVRSVAFSPDGRRILTGSWDKTAKVWDAETSRELLTLKGHTAEVWSVVFAPDGRRILTGSDDATAKVWMMASPEEVEAWQKEEEADEPKHP